MNKTIAAGFALLVFLLACAAQPARAEPDEEYMIARAKAVDVSRLDPQLPGMPLGDWFDQALGKGSAYLWTVHPCEEANDSRPRLCANIFARHGDAAIVISFSFPKEEPGMNGQPYPATVMLSGVGDGNQFMGSLHALVEALRRYDAAAKRAP